MKLLKIQRTDTYVRFSHETKGPTIKANDPKNPGTVKEHVSTEERVVTAHEAPLASFDKALQGLSQVAANILETDPGWTEGITVTALSISYTKTGIRSASIVFSRKLDATGKSHQMDTPFFQIDDGKTPDEGRRECSESHAKAVMKMIGEAERYAEGERQQQQLKFDKDDGETAEPSEGDELDYGGDTKPEEPEKPAKKKRGRKAAAVVA